MKRGRRPGRGRATTTDKAAQRVAPHDGTRAPPGPIPTMSVETDRQRYQFPDGSTVELTVRTSDAAAFAVVTTQLARRLGGADRVVDPVDPPGRDASLRAYREFAPAPPTGSGDRSTATHPLPGGEVTVAVDAGRAGTRGYLHYLVRDAVAYARVTDVDARRAAPLAILLVGAAAALAAAGYPIASLPPLGAGLVVGGALLVHLLAARGVAPDLSRRPTPTDR